MSREIVNTYCKTLPGAEWSEPFGEGHDVWKVGGKIFAAVGASTQGVSVKCVSVDQALHLEDIFGWGKAPYFHRSWVLVPWDTAEDEIHHRIQNSYETIRASLPKKIRDAIDQS